jgi:hypothetical protein
MTIEVIEMIDIKQKTYIEVRETTKLNKQKMNLPESIVWVGRNKAIKSNNKATIILNTQNKVLMIVNLNKWFTVAKQ